MTLKDIGHKQTTGIG